MCFWTLTDILTFERLGVISEQAEFNNDGHGFICLDCDDLEISLLFDMAYQNNLIKHFNHTLIHHSRITSCGETNITNVQPIQTYLGHTLIHNGTCNLKKVEELRKKVNTSLRGANISDTVSMAILLDNSKTEEEIIKLMSDFNDSDFIGNLAYKRKDENKVYLDLRRGTYDPKRRFVETAGQQEIKGYFDLESKTFHLSVSKSKPNYQTSWLSNYNYYNDYEINVPVVEEEQEKKSSDVCTYDLDMMFCRTKCDLHNCHADYCFCCDFVDNLNHCGFECVPHGCKENNCQCPLPLYDDDNQEFDKEYQAYLFD